MTPRLPLRILLLCLFFLGISVVPIAAQGQLGGQVVDSVSGQPLIGAMITIEGLNVRVATDTAGRFLLTNVPAGERVVLAEYIGYEPARARVLVPGGDTAFHAFFNLRPVSGGIALDPIVVTNYAWTRAVYLAFPLAAVIAVLLLIHLSEGHQDFRWAMTIGASVAGAIAGVFFAALWLGLGGTRAWEFPLQGLAIGAWLGVWRSKTSRHPIVQPRVDG